MRGTLRKIAPLATPVALALAILITFARCTPTWLPDGSGFVFVAPGGAVTLHNLKTGKSTQLALGSGPGAGVAAWPAGDRVTVVRSDEAEPAALRIRTYDLDGNEKDASGPIKLELGDKENQWLTSIAVAPDGKHIVAFAPGPQLAIIYDVERKTHRKIEKVLPLGYVAGLIAAGGVDQKIGMSFDVSPLPPDGKGFVALRTDGESPAVKFIYVPLAGGEPVELKLAEEDQATITKRSEQKERSVALVPQWAGGNMGGVVEMQIDDLVLRLDVAKRKASLVTDMASEAVFQHAQRNKVRVFCRLAGGSLLQLNEENQVQLWRRSGETTLVMKLEEDGFLAISPSPDRQKILVRLIRGEHDRLLAIDAQGRTLADLKHEGRKE
jgi:hypothetical protein